MNRRHWLLLIGAPVALWLTRGKFYSTPLPSRSITDFLGDQASANQYQRVTGARQFSFPEDHAAHPDYQHEWWYFTGNLRASTGRAFGFQLTFFRFAFSPTDPTSRSAWATRQALLGHFALTDVENQRFHAFQRLERPVLGLAGLARRPFSIWIKNWRATLDERQDMRWTLEATQEHKTLALQVTPTKAYVPQGANGYSVKGPEPGNASHYYSSTRMLAQGFIELDGTRFEVTGQAWLDREWGSGALASGVIGWDWFGLQLFDGSELTLYLLRKKNGSRTPFSAGSWVSSDGSMTRLSVADFSVRILRHWRSTQTHATYPAGWQLNIPRLKLSLEVEPLLAAQEWTQLIRYWEGNVRVKGTRDGHPIGGAGYVELTGY